MAMGSSSSRQYRSVLDFETEEELTRALRAVAVSSGNGGSSSSSSSYCNSSNTSLSSSTAHSSAGDLTATTSCSSNSNSSSSVSVEEDWVLRNYDRETTFESSVEHEAKRLTVLKSYQALDCESEPALDNLTKEVRERFNVPWAVLSLVDFGRQWFVSIDKDDLGVSETSRQAAFCAHTIRSKRGSLVVPHALEDDRFRNNSIVQGAPGLRFYAGVSLVAPEGYNLGTLCVFDRKPRPGGITQGEHAMLKSKAADAVKFLVQRRNALERKESAPPPPLKALPAAQEHQQEEEQQSAAMKRVKSAPTLLFSPNTNKKLIGREGMKKPRRQSVMASVESFSDESSTASSNSDDCVAVAPDIGVPLAASPTNLIQRNDTATAVLPDPKSTDVDPDKYLSMLCEARLGLALKIRPALDLQDYFHAITEAQVAAYSMEVLTAARVNDVAKLRKFYDERGRECLDCYNRFGEGLLNLSCRRGFKEMVKFLLSEDIKLDVRICDDYGRCPLHDACWNPEPQLEICEWIMAIDPSLFLISDKRGYTPFQYARKSDWPVWRTFLHANVERLDALSQPDIVSRFS